MAKSKKLIFIAVLSLIFASGVFSAVQNAKAEPDKQYRSGQIIAMDNRNYLIANNKEFAEIIEITADNKLVQVSEIHGAPKIEDLYVGKYLGRYFMVIAAGQYLYRYDISDPRAPKIEFKRDLYVFRRGQFRIGSVNILAGNKDFLFGGGSNGTRSFNQDNLFVNKIYTFDKTYGLAADAKNLYVITETKGMVFDVLSGVKLSEVDLENKEKMARTPAYDGVGNAYFPTDRGIVKLNPFTGEIKLYVNPVPKTENFSYGAAGLPGGEVYYANGHGITVFDKNFVKSKFLKTSGAGFGLNPWAVGITAVRIGARDLIIDFNKSQILLFDKNLKVLARYSYKKSYPENITFNLKIIPSVNKASAGQKISLKLFGFWPNEEVNLAFGKNSYVTKVDNQGYGVIELAVPNQPSRTAVIQATGNDSKFNYQVSFIVL